MMNNRPYIVLFLFLMVLGFMSCKKDEDPNIQSITFEREYFQYTPTTVTVSGVYAYDGRIDGIKMQVGKRNDLADAHAFVADIDGTNYTVEATGLQPGTEYHYCYEVDYGFSKPYKTETKTFATPADSPLVKTLEVMALDSTTVRVKCEVVAEGGQEVTERGICWNTYGDPTLDDETMQHASGGVGQYTLRIEGLALSTKYYVRAYAKNASGIGFGEVLEFETLAEAQLPEVSTVEVGNVTSTTANCMGNVASDGGLELTERGVCWSLSANPTLASSHAAASDATLGVFEVAMTGLTPNKTYHVRAYATNAKGTAYGDDLTFTTTEGLPVVTTSGITEITATSAKGGGEVTDQGASNVTERGICWGTSHNPTISGTHANNGTGAGSYTVSMTNLTPNATYYVRAYATNAQGTAYGAEVSFMALEGLPVVLTLDMTDITSTTAKGHGKVTDQGGSAVTERGICWSTSPSPTISGSHANSGTGTGEYAVSISNLTPGTKYYVRAYATNDQGTTYGEQKDFTTAATLPTVVTGNISGTTVHGEVTDAGGAIVTERGICWGTSHNPTTAGTHGSSGTGTGTFSVELTDLAPGTTYYVRAYAINSAGTAYGSEKTLTTQATLPTVTTGEVSNITQTSAQGSGNVTNDGGASVTERGVCWSTSHNPTISGSHAYNGTGTGGYTVNMTGLTANTHYYVRAYAKNSAGVSYGNEVDFTTAQNVSAPTVTTTQVTNVAQTTATGGGNVTNSGGATVTERGICWSTSHNPTTSGSHANSGTGTGSFTVNMTGLTANTTYYVRAYAINSAGTSYGSEVSFTTQQALTVPTVTTSQVTNIQQTSATGGGNVTNSGGANVTERGICWSTSHNPTTSGSHASNGTGTGSYTVNMSGLSPGTTYYVRAYAINSQGTAYGSEVTFTTTAGLPTVTTSQVTNITQTSATGGGNVTATGGANVTERGICWGTSHNPTTSNSHANSGTGTGTYTVNMASLTANTTYYVRAYAINSAGTAYGSEVSFTTSDIPNYTIAVSANPSSGGTVSGGGTYQQGQSCTVTASANTGYTFLRWTENGSQVSTNADYTFTVSGNRTLVAQFQAQNYTISVSANPSNGGVVNGGGSYNYGQTCTVVASANSGYEFTNWTEGGSVVSNNASYSFTVSGNRTLVANFESSVPIGAINGLFTINDNGDQVYFSQGNLQYIGSASTPYWKFADHQWDYLGTTTGQNSSEQNVDRDLFGWGTSGYNHGAICYQPWSTSWFEEDYLIYGESSVTLYNLYDQSGQADWGYNAILNGGNTENCGWRTMTRSEWYYVIIARSTESGARFAKGCVNGINGVIVFPDEWNVSYYAISNINDGTASFNNNTLFLSQWTTLEQFGAVFLPASGNRIRLNVGGGNMNGCYWSSTAGAWHPDIMFFSGERLNPNDDDEYEYSEGYSVRLVKDNNQ